MRQSQSQHQIQIFRTSRRFEQFFCQCWAKNVCSSRHNISNWILKIKIFKKFENLIIWKLKIWKISKLLNLIIMNWFHVQRASRERELQAMLQDLRPSHGSVDVAETMFFALSRPCVVPRVHKLRSGSIPLQGSDVKYSTHLWHSDSTCDARACHGFGGTHRIVGPIFCALHTSIWP